MKRNSLFLFCLKASCAALAIDFLVSACTLSKTYQAEAQLLQTVAVKYQVEAQSYQAEAGICQEEAQACQAEAKINVTKIQTVGVPSNVILPQHRNMKYVKKGVYLGKRNIGGMSEYKLEEMLKNIALKTDVEAKDAVFDEKTWTIYKETVGVRLNIYDIVYKALAARPGAKLKYTYIITKPNVTAAQLGKDVSMIAKFTTPILDRSKSRVNNIRLVSGKIDGRIIKPGEEFSFNKITGRKTKALGYEDATIIVRTPKGPEHKKGTGGGVCQVSTTIYNAVLQCGLKVTERHGHSDEVYYVPKGKDATVAYNWADFRFVNNREYPVMLKIYIGKKTVQVRIIENRRPLPCYYSE